MIQSLLALGLLSAAALPQAVDPTSAPKSVEKEKKVCREDAATGSIMPKRICHSRAEWAAIEAQQQQDLDTFHNRRPRPGS